MTRTRFHGLKRVKFRMTWNKYNLYNLSRLKARPNIGTLFQQKWAAKSATRAYHGEQIREKQWQGMFDSRLNAVIPMDHRYLAQYDGSEQAAGRGSGAEKRPGDPLREHERPARRVPYMSMTYAPIERRLDVAIFRALFASSARQARQFVTHGSVKVNGKKIQYPGYLLNPGDMFQVEPERVLYATGAAKSPEQIREGREIRKARRLIHIRRHERRATAREEAVKRALAKRAAPGETVRSKKCRDVPMDEKEARKQRKADLQELVKHVQAIMDNRKLPPSAKRKQELRQFLKDVRKAMAQVNQKTVKDLQENLSELFARLSIANTKTKSAEKSGTSLTVIPSSDAPSATPPSSVSVKTPQQQAQKQMRKKLLRVRQNPVDESKPYATPWAPRPYMSAFAFIPRYLEVNHRICSAVYLRHPVARPGLSEVPTPFAYDTMQLAYTWYLRRR
ncbi:hypothetical protein HYALB_00001414 [Hymenoscyphus albidus]|uniref:Small ribosomal subunit protein uS4m n=1 Tax=Hymenoscyphus albidus TaxID=595503 RepID=A0A9N9PQE9_9HELO|nr:hypothetical protein HYALB_00001414 [Hymenoscyphus albidus]